MRTLLSILLLAGGVYLAFAWLTATPQHEREWQAPYAKLPQVTTVGERVAVENVRNWSYATSGEPTAKEWQTATITPATLEQVYFLVEPFGAVPGIAHTMLAFAFADGATYVVSIEARREVGEEYQALRSIVWPTHEYLYLWATERDMYANTHLVAEDELYRYPLVLTEQEAQLLLTTVLEETRSVAAEPRWYHTLLANCTNVLTKALNKKTNNSVPWGLAFILPGRAEEYLYAHNFVDTTDPLGVVRQNARIDQLVPQVYGKTDPVAFSRALTAAQAEAASSAP